MNALSIKKALAGVAIAASSIGFAAAPAFAAKNTGGYQRSSEGIKADTNPNTNGTCDTLWGYFEGDVNRAQAAYDAGDANAMNHALSEARQAYQGGVNAGCDWASRVAPPQAPGPVPTSTPVGAHR